MNDVVTREFERRKRGEREKALRKYGEDALIPTGRPDYDVHDYAINELIGLIRYAEMLKARADMMDQLFEGAARRSVLSLIREQRKLALDMTDHAEDLAQRLIYIRQRLIAKGHHLGLEESAS